MKFKKSDCTMMQEVLRMRCKKADTSHYRLLLEFFPGLPGSRRHGHFPQMWPFKKMYCREKFTAVSGRKVAVKVSKMLKYGRGK
jgi:hypothetical protein